MLISNKMSTTKSWNKLSAVLQSVLSNTLDKTKADSVMSEWNEKKSEVTKLVGSGRVKRKKDANAPKKWKTSYILFCCDKREELKSKNPDMPATEITSELGKLWKSLTDKNKKKYQDLSAKDKIRYEKDMESYTPPPEDELEDKPKKAPKKERVGPKRPLSSYMYFCQDTRDSVKKDNPEMNGKEVTSELGRRWKELTDAEKKPFEAKGAVDKLRYEKEKVQLPGAEASPAPSSTKTSAKETKTKDKPKAKTETKAVKPAPEPTKTKPSSKKEEPVKKTPGFDFYLKEQRDDMEAEHPDWDGKKLVAELEKKWKKLQPEDRESYEIEAQEENESDGEELSELSD